MKTRLYAASAVKGLTDQIPVTGNEVGVSINHQDLQMFGIKLNIYEQFSPTWFVGYGSETQLQVGEI